MFHRSKPGDYNIVHESDGSVNFEVKVGGAGRRDVRWLNFSEAGISVCDHGTKIAMSQYPYEDITHCNFGPKHHIISYSNELEGLKKLQFKCPGKQRELEDTLDRFRSMKPKTDIFLNY
eukprot:TRINITY_DN7912_c0_g1_i3.p1 TRINITY_DN7912_c0_g1~~TRINITY_DN7912_c0_g1_i3.p1  ORF type:complete len:119 (-),score=13.88 TRINITY_DN7912_c0_g1_i3:79-435(-)